MHDDHQFQGIKLDFNSIKKASLILRTLNNKVCQRIFELLARNSEMTVTEIYTALFLEQSVASMHLAKMRRHKIVTTKRNGKNILYGLNTERLAHINSILKQLSEVSSVE
jgi:ArsR family transcriptional regulator